MTQQHVSSELDVIFSIYSHFQEFPISANDIDIAIWAFGTVLDTNNIFFGCEPTMYELNSTHAKTIPV